LERASEIARDMVTRLGMSEALGPLTYGRRQLSLYLGSDYVDERTYSEATAQQIDAAVKASVEDGHQRARAFLDRQRGLLDILAARLQEREVLTGEEVQALLEEHQHLLVTD
jgi:cell division protease FtsH